MRGEKDQGVVPGEEEKKNQLDVGSGDNKRMVEGVSSSMIYLRYCKNFGKCHSKKKIQLESTPQAGAVWESTPQQLSFWGKLIGGESLGSAFLGTALCSHTPWKPCSSRAKLLQCQQHWASPEVIVFPLQQFRSHPW
jgi:hypothetical protein